MIRYLNLSLTQNLKLHNLKTFYYKAQKKLQEERTAVLKKPQSKSRFNFLQDFLSHSQFTMKPSEFRRRRQADLGLVQRFELSHMLDGHKGCVNAM